MLLPLDKDKKSESKSQHLRNTLMKLISCCRWTKIKNLKANHNKAKFCAESLKVVAVGQR